MRLTPLSLLRGLIAAPLLALVILSANIIQVCSLLFYPISRPLFRGINHSMSGIWWAANYFASTKILGHKIIFSGHEALPNTENVIVISNHQTMSDIPCIMALAYLKKSGSNAKFFVKDPLKWVPGIGWGMHFLNYIFLKRNWHRDAKSILKTFETIRNDSIPLWLVNFPEGTRATPAKLAISQGFARQKNLKVLENVMIPRTKGVTSTITGLKDHFDAVYDFTIYYGKEAPSLLEFYVCKLVPIHVHVERIPASLLTGTEEELALWLHERFHLKDERIKTIKQTGAFV